MNVLLWMGTMKLAFRFAVAVCVALAAGVEAAAGSDCCCERCKARIAVYTTNAHRARIEYIILLHQVVCTCPGESSTG